MTATNKELQQVPALLGVGHQFKADQKALNACQVSLQDSANHISEINNSDVRKLFSDINALIFKARHLSYSANEAFKIND